MKHFHDKHSIFQKTSFRLFISAILLLIIIFYFLKPIPQPATYHQFADQRSSLGIPNAANVLSNIAIAFPGILGLFLMLFTNKMKFKHYHERWLWIAVSVGFILTAVGSIYYHLAPDNSRLVWDRLPMTFVFMSFAAALISERVNAYLGLWLWPALIFIGFLSVFVWYESELQGNSDLRFYIAIQAFVILVAIIMLLSSPPYDRNQDLVAVIICYCVAVLFELNDRQIYGITRNVVSGHTLKHMTIGVLGTWIIWMIWKRGKWV